MQPCCLDMNLAANNDIYLFSLGAHVTNRNPVILIAATPSTTAGEASFRFTVDIAIGIALAPVAYSLWA